MAMLMRVVIFEQEARFWRPDMPWFRVYQGINRAALEARLTTLGYKVDYFGNMSIYTHNTNGRI